MIQKTGIQRAVDMFDGVPAKLAEAVGNGVLRQHVEHWLKAGRVGPEKCPEVAVATGIPCEELNDRVNWALARETAPAAGVQPVATARENEKAMGAAFNAGVIKDQRVATQQQREVDRIRDAKLAAFEAAEAQAAKISATGAAHG